MATIGKTTAFAACGLFLTALAGLVFVVITASSATERENMILSLQRDCERAGGVLYTAKGESDAPAICHKKGAPLGTDEPLWEWETVLFVEGQV